MTTTPNQKILRERLLEMSEANSWNEAQQEWEPVSIWQEPDGVCLCTHQGIVDHCLIKNKLNGNTAVVGNVCIKQFQNMPQVAHFFSDIRRLQSNPSPTSIPERLIHDGHAAGLFSDWDYRFLLDIRLKRNLSSKQFFHLDRCIDKLQRSLEVRPKAAEAGS